MHDLCSHSPVSPPAAMTSLVIFLCFSACLPPLSSFLFSRSPHRWVLIWRHSWGPTLHRSTGAHTDEVDLSRPQEAHTPSSRALIKIQRYCRFPGREGSSKKILLKIEWEECLIRVSFLLKSDYIAAPTPPHSLQLWNLFWPFLSPCGLGFYLASSGEWGDWQQRWWKIYKAKCVGTWEKHLCQMCVRASLTENRKEGWIYSCSLIRTFTPTCNVFLWTFMRLKSEHLTPHFYE